MSRKYKNHTPELKLKVALEASKNEKTTNQIASEFGVYPSQVTEWKKQLMDNGSQLFQNKRQTKPNPEACEDVALLQQQVGRLTVQLDWLKKKLGSSS
jgi:transposase